MYKCNIVLPPPPLLHSNKILQPKSELSHSSLQSAIPMPWLRELPSEGANVQTKVDSGGGDGHQRPTTTRTRATHWPGSHARAAVAAAATNGEAQSLHWMMIMSMIN